MGCVALTKAVSGHHSIKSKNTDGFGPPINHLGKFQDTLKSLRLTQLVMLVDPKTTQKRKRHFLTLVQLQKSGQFMLKAPFGGKCLRKQHETSLPKWRALSAGTAFEVIDCP